MKHLWYLSFASADGFAGGCVVEADDMLDAVQESIRRGCNGGPDTSVLGMLVPEEYVTRARAHMNVLMSKADMTARGLDPEPYVIE